jgi:unsaturated rhamnogalacturonyl hydrolase
MIIMNDILMELKNMPYNNQWAQKMSDSVMVRDPELCEKWSYDYGVVFKGIQQVWLKTQDKKYFDYIKKNMDMFIDEDGDIRKYSGKEHNIDHVNNGKILFLLYKETGEERYKKAAYLLREQLNTHPRTKEGGFWHKQIYTNQMWLDGLYMGSPFYAEFTKIFGDKECFDDVAKQIILMEKYAKDPATGLLYHGWDESKEQKWSNKETGCSPNFWSRAMGWYTMAIVDVLEHLPEDHFSRNRIIEILNKVMEALVKVQDENAGVWYQVLDKADREGNYLEASGSCMFAYAMAKGISKGYLSEKYLEVLAKAYKGIIDNFIEVDEEGLVNLKGTCMVAGLGGTPYRDGSYEYYISEPIKYNDLKGVGAFIKASAEVEKLLRW